MEAVKVITTDYEWVCPNCKYDNYEVGKLGLTVECSSCTYEYVVSLE